MQVFGLRQDETRLNMIFPRILPREPSKDSFQVVEGTIFHERSCRVSPQDKKGTCLIEGTHHEPLHGLWYTPRYVDVTQVTRPF